MKQVHLFIQGHVQGVGYRKFVRFHARKLGLTGWVQNLPDGSVECVAQGEEKLLKRLISILKNGPPIARVEQVRVIWESASEDLQDFLIYR